MKAGLVSRCFDPEPGRIGTHLMDRDGTDNLILDDHVSVMFDPFNDERREFQFRANPLGVQAEPFSPRPWAFLAPPSKIPGLA